MKTSKPVLASTKQGNDVPRLLAASALGFALLTSPACRSWAGDEKTQPPATKPAVSQVKKTAPQKDALVEITGSRIKQKVRRSGHIATSASSPVLVVDREAIERSGASTIPGVLAKTIGHR